MKMNSSSQNQSMMMTWDWECRDHPQWNVSKKETLFFPGPICIYWPKSDIFSDMAKMTRYGCTKQPCFCTSWGTGMANTNHIDWYGTKLTSLLLRLVWGQGQNSSTGLGVSVANLRKQKATKYLKLCKCEEMEEKKNILMGTLRFLFESVASWKEEKIITWCNHDYYNPTLIILHISLSIIYYKIWIQ